MPGSTKRFMQAVVVSDKALLDAPNAAPKPDLLTRNDPLLEALIVANDDAARLRHVETLVVEHATPLIRRIVARCARTDHQLREQDSEDVIATVTLRLIRKLRLLSAEQGSIRQFQDYVATLTYNTVYDFLRRRFPERSRLKNRLRYVLSRDSRLSLWDAPSGLAAGLAEWDGSSIVAQRIDLPDESTTRAMLDADAPASALLAIFRHLGAPVSLDALTDATASLWGISDSFRPVTEALSETEPSPLERAESRQFLEALWSEILQLGRPHRAALLLNLRDGGGINAIPQFLLLGIASFDEIASAIGIAPEALAEIWNSLPLEDLKIAEMLGATRQQVINFRKTARERLARRMVRQRP
jgi:RNA polymerase sigma factor (sigma-70 family)